MKKLVDKDMIGVRPVPYTSNQEIYDALYKYQNLEEKIQCEINRIANENYIEVDKYNTLIWVLEQLKD